MMIRRGVALALVWLAVAAPAVMAQSQETPPDPLVIVQSAIVRDVVEPGDLLAVGVYNIGSMTSPSGDVPSAAGERAGRPARRGNARALLRSRNHERRLVRHAGRVGVRGVLGVQASVRRRSRERVSRAFEKRTTAVSLFRINVRLGGQHKCHSVRLRWYQVMASRAPHGIAASEDSPCPCIS